MLYFFYGKKSKEEKFIQLVQLFCGLFTPGSAFVRSFIHLVSGCRLNECILVRKVCVVSDRIRVTFSGTGLFQLASSLL